MLDAIKCSTTSARNKPFPLIIAKCTYWAHSSPLPQVHQKHAILGINEHCVLETENPFFSSAWLVHSAFKVRNTLPRRVLLPGPVMLEDTYCKRQHCQWESQPIVLSWKICP